MNLQVLSLRVLATRQVVKNRLNYLTFYLILSYSILSKTSKNRLNYSTFLNGTAKDELDGLDRVEGSFRIQASKITIEAHYKGKRLPSDDWGTFKECFNNHLPSGLIKFIEGDERFNIVERKDERLTRTWFLSDVDGSLKSLLYSKGELVQMNGALVHFDDFIEDGWFLKVQKAFKMHNGKMELVFHCQDSLTTNKQGNVLRRYMWSVPNKDIKVTKVMWALRDLNRKTFWPLLL